MSKAEASAKAVAADADLDAGKEEKSAVDYSTGGKDHCGVCRFYIKINAGGGRCTKVKGPIQPWKWCKRFRKKSD